ncbi:hypothetical protein [Niabella beijingensis]|uniref:hypothetical protein n=1 Tax=Niabella beijingensis TaxID=2872700 RepID=UPI001CC0AED6|nr:hypothetical protein [Niabella beijingensis]MBZ4192160.1 hypothetical protein [Niabella beijingensis]
MSTQKSFNVAVRQKVPYLTNLFLLIGIVCFLVLLVFDVLFAPFKSAGQEVQAAVFYWLVPEFWKYVLLIAAIGFCSTALIYGVLRYYKAAILSFTHNEILIKGKAINMRIPIKSIRAIYCNDAMTQDGQLKQKLSITIEQKRKRKATAIKLRDYHQSEYFMEQLMKYEPLDLKPYNFGFNPTHMEES